MGLFDALRKPQAGVGEPKAESPIKGEESVEAKFNETCAVCGKAPTEVKWMGQFFHKKCRRLAKKMAGKML